MVYTIHTLHTIFLLYRKQFFIFFFQNIFFYIFQKIEILNFLKIITTTTNIYYFLNNMTNFTELQCFNKLLLQKIERLQKENNELKKENKFLIERVDNAQNILEDKDFSQCIDCCLYYDSDGLEFGEMGSDIRCRECDIKNEKEKFN